VRGEQHGKLPVLTADHYRLTLRSIEHGRESLLASVAETYRIECAPEFI
jgi:hypothetical protein